MNDIVNDKKGHNIVNDSFTHEPDGLLVINCCRIRIICYAENTFFSPSEIYIAVSGLNVVLNVLKPDTNDSIFQALCQLISNFVDSCHVRNALEYEKSTRWQS